MSTRGRPVSGATLNDLDRRRLRDYFSRVREQAAPSDRDGAAWRTLLVNTEIMVEEGVTVGWDSPVWEYAEPLSSTGRNRRCGFSRN